MYVLFVAASSLKHTTRAMSHASAIDTMYQFARRGRWRQAQQVLTKLKDENETVPKAAYHAVLMALRKKAKLDDLFQNLAEMDDRIDTDACNEALHALRLRKTAYEEALPLWNAMKGLKPASETTEQCEETDDLRFSIRRAAQIAAAAGDNVTPDSLSYTHLLIMCEKAGLWKEATALLSDISFTLYDEKNGEVSFDRIGHITSALRACTRDHRWKEAASLAYSIPEAVFSNSKLARLFLDACAKAGDAVLAGKIVSYHLSEQTQVRDYVQWMCAARASEERNCVSIRRAWDALCASNLIPDEQCYAHFVGGILDVDPRLAHCGFESTLEETLSVESEAIALIQEATAKLQPERAVIVLMAGLGRAVQHNLAPLAFESLQLLNKCGFPAEIDAQLRAMKVFAECKTWHLIQQTATEAISRCDPESFYQADLQFINEIEMIVQKEIDASMVTDQLRPSALGAIIALRELKDVAGKSVESLPQFRPRTRPMITKNKIPGSREYSRSLAIPPNATPLQILWEDEDLLVVNKPAGVSAVPRHRFEGNSMVNRAVHHLKGRAPYVLHRLDFGTSGVLVFAKTLGAARMLAEQFKDRSLSKTYLAVLCGTPPDSFDVDVSIARHPELPLSIAVSDSSIVDRAQEARTKFDVLARCSDASLCVVKPIQGRMHQIRLHSEFFGHPVAGDSQYGEALQPSPPLDRLLLHAHVLALKHPNGRRARFTAPPPDDYRRMMQRLGFGTEIQSWFGEENILWDDEEIHTFC